MIFKAFLTLYVLVSASATVTTSSAYNPTDVFLFNCGDPSNNTDASGRYWTAEILPTNSIHSSFSSNALNQISAPRVPYMKARIFRSDFTYNFPVSPGSKFLRLYFHPTRYGSDFNAVTSFFSVTVNGFTLLKNFSADLTAKDSNSEFFVKEFIVPVFGVGSTSSSLLNLTFTPSSPSSLAFVNGIEIVSMPDQFYSKGGFDKVITTVGSSVDYLISNLTAFETVYRLNVGGQTIGNIGDSGMFRQWLRDEFFYFGKKLGIEANNSGVKINYNEKTPAYVAPKDVYATSRAMGNPANPKVNLNFNLTWVFKVDAGFNYLVRLLFCEYLEEEVIKPGQRVFSISINNHTAKRHTDVIQLSGGLRIPMYLDFNIYINGTSERQDLQLDLYPLPQLAIKYYDSILNGVEILKLSDFYGNLAGTNLHNINDLESNLTNRNSKRTGDMSHTLKITLTIVGSTIGLVTFIVVLLLLLHHLEKKKKNKKDNNVVMFKVLLKHYTYAEVKKITKSFSNVIGKGGFGIVYGGNLCNGRKVAVKVLKDSSGNGEDFINEVASMSQTSHVNIVCLLGFCYEGNKRAIVYEFLENGSLDKFISRKKSLKLDVTVLYGIALGVARGLEYLHYGCKTRIVHFDIKPQNILLDENLCPKVSDFGLAKLCEKRESIVSLINTRGTIGYIAPEVFSRMYGNISHKSDVYSYGMLVLEMIGAKNNDIAETAATNASSAYFPDWIYKHLEIGEHAKIFGDEITIEEKDIAKKMILVALWCVQPYPSDRPPMNKVVEMMEGSLDDLEVPPKPSMNVSVRPFDESSSISKENSNTMRYIGESSSLSG
ncbi:unnamed protein product [Cochlearia groenlandica]